jgi:hypothetical protein
MNPSLLLPNKWKRIGWFILIPATIAGILITILQFDAGWVKAPVFAFFFDNSVFGQSGSFSWITVDVTNTLVGTLWLIGAMIVAFSQEKEEDEFINRLRLSSLLWSVWVNYLLLLFAFIFIYGFSFLHVMIYNMFTILIIFIIRFNLILYRSTKLNADEK